jgi:spermidine/putrescine transport system ATP-binding protein
MDKVVKEENNFIIKLEDVTRQFEDGVFAVDNMNLAVKKGEFVTFLGPSGCGKTTTLRMIAGFDKPTSGKILLNGKDITDLPPYKRPINTVFQKYALFPHLNIFENVAYGLKLKKLKVVYEAPDGKRIEKIEKLSKTEISEKVKKALKIVDKDSALGFEPSMGYGGDRAHIEWKIRQVKHMMEYELGIYEKGLKF